MEDVRQMVAVQIQPYHDPQQLSKLNICTSSANRIPYQYFFHILGAYVRVNRLRFLLELVKKLSLGYCHTVLP